MKNLVFEINGEMVQGTVLRHRGVLWAHVAGETFVYEPLQKGRRSKTSTAQNDGEIKAPMPGKIVKVCVEKAQEVKSGDLLVVMEAMKMEYSLTAPHDGLITEVVCRPLDQVQLGQKLAHVKKKAAEET